MRKGSYLNFNSPPAYSEVLALVFAMGPPADQRTAQCALKAVFHLVQPFRGKYARRMPFTAWVAPSLVSMRLRSIVRHVESLSVQSAQNQNCLHAAQGSTSTPAAFFKI